MVQVAAVDLGATSARVAVVDTDSREVSVVHRCDNGPVPYADGSLRWDWDGLVREVEHGLSLAVAHGVESIGVDTWGVDYGLLDHSGELVAPPFSYRDARTSGWRQVVDRIGEQRLYETTGVQLMAINTIFQLAAHDRAELARAATLLMLPELLVHRLTGAIAAEVTSAGTSGLVSLETGTWSDDLLTEILPELGRARPAFPPIRRPGSMVGDWRGVPVHLVGGHDTASAVAGRPGPTASNRAFVATGTWVLVGVESPAPVTSGAAYAANFSNERSVDGGYRLLKNVTGLWLLERCREVWGSARTAEIASEPGPIVDPNEDGFAKATDMPAAIAAATGLRADDAPAITRCIFDSIAVAVARVIDEVSAVTGTLVIEIDMFGGGAQIPALVDAVATATRLPITVGAPEATLLGNALVQARSLGT